MGIEKVETADGVKLRHSDTKALAGSLGNGMKPPTVSANPKFSRDLQESVDERKTYADIVSPKKQHQIRAQMKARKIIEEQVRLQGSNNITLSFGSIEEQLAKFNSWASEDSVVQDLYAPDVNYRYDLLEPILNSEHDDLDYDSARALRRLGYEHYYAQRLPIFIVGSRVAGSKFDWLSGSIREVDHGFIEGVKVADNDLPSAIVGSSEDASVEGTLVWIKTEPIGTDSRISLDKMQGFDKDNPWDSQYVRTIREVNNGKFTRPAWVYVAKH